MSATEIIKAAQSQGLMIATAESCTGGLVAAALTDISGASQVLERGVVTYSNQAKQELLGVTETSLASYGAVSEQVAKEMAEGLLARAPVQLVVSVTGIAGPGGSEFKPEGRVCFGLARSGQDTQTETVEFGAIGRPDVRQAACDHALNRLAQALCASR